MKTKTFILTAAGVVAAAGIATGIIVAATSSDREAVEVAAPTQAASPTETTTPVVTAPADGLSDGIDASAATAAGEKDRRDAVNRAVTAMMLFARPMVSAQMWMDELSPYLSQQAASDIEGTDPSLVPVDTVFGSELVPGATNVAATVTVRTNIGEYQVGLTRTSPDEQWLVAQFIPPEGVK